MSEPEEEAAAAVSAVLPTGLAVGAVSLVAGGILAMVGWFLHG